MANKEVKERNRTSKGKTGPLTIKRRKRRGLKAKPSAAKTTKGKASVKK